MGRPKNAPRGRLGDDGSLLGCRVRRNGSTIAARGRVPMETSTRFAPESLRTPHEGCCQTTLSRMDREAALRVCRSIPGATEGFPFGAGALVFKVGGKMFAILGADDLSLKCDPGLALALREQFPAVTAGYHLDKRHWNTIALDGSVPDDHLHEWIQDSYDLVLAGLTRAQRATLTL